ncbi:MAG: hypothetical protein LBF54_01310 [Holosporaceae bacterium]|nr:hypothetical protein [Holosporaceae bacterium]
MKRLLFTLGCVYLSVLANFDIEELQLQQVQTEDDQQNSDLPGDIREKCNVFESWTGKFPEFDPAYNSPANIYDQIAKRLAGLYIPDLNNQTFIDYAKSINEEWKKLHSCSLSKISEWSNTNITPHIKDLATLFYPFGGPDIAYPLKFFPQMQNYILVGLEPIGNFEKIRENIGNESTLAALKRAFSSYFKKGYFITSEMITQLSNKNVRGALYLILVELAKSEFIIDSIEDLSISSEGQEIARQKGMVDCVKIVFRSVEGSAPKNLFYIRADLTNSNKKLGYLMNFMQRFSFATFIKSASYVLHDRLASRIKNYILENAYAILQDDTGIPFHNFGPGWSKHAFGQYKQPTLSIFKGYKQKDLSDFFSSANPVDIPFKIGYGFNQERPNLVLLISPRKIAEQMHTLRNNKKDDDQKSGCPCKKGKKSHVI